MKELVNILEQVKKKIPLSGIESIKQGLMTGRLKIDDYIENVYNKTNESLKNIVEKYHLPLKLLKTFDKYDKGKIIHSKTNEWYALHKVLPHGHVGERNIKGLYIDFESTITDKFVVTYISMPLHKEEFEFFSIVPRNS